MPVNIDENRHWKGFCQVCFTIIGNLPCAGQRCGGPMFRHSVTAGECLIPGTLFLKKQFKPRMNADRHRSEEVAKNPKSANRGKTLFIKICFPGKKTSAKERKEHEGNSPGVGGKEKELCGAAVLGEGLLGIDGGPGRRGGASLYSGAGERRPAFGPTYADAALSGSRNKQPL
jgi:hypothetical protein